MREVAAEFERPVLLFSGGKDSIVMLRAGREGVLAGPHPVPGDARRHRAQLPRGARLPRPAGGRARRPAGRGAACRTRSTPAGSPRRPAGRAPRNRLQTTTLLDAIEEHRFDALFGGARRDEEKARAKERVFSLPRRVRPVGPEEPAARAVVPVQRPAPPRRAHPGVPAVQLDRARRLALHRSARNSTLPSHLLRARARGVRARRACCCAGQRVT